MMQVYRVQLYVTTFCTIVEMVGSTGKEADWLALLMTRFLKQTSRL